MSIMLRRLEAYLAVFFVLMSPATIALLMDPTQSTGSPTSTINTGITSTAQCQDDAAFGCQRVSALLNLCADVQHAKVVCRKFCGLCDLDGAWSAWSSWGVCSATCNGGLQSRTRTCNNPAPSRFGQPCQGNDVDKQLCNGQTCPATNGAWSSWSAWGVCSSTCNGGLQSRARTCNKPAPSRFGLHCLGTDIDKQFCNGQSCPATNGAWSAWTNWGTCSATCNGGLQSRTRTCTNPAPTQFGRDCSGNDVDKRLCNSKNCLEKAVAFSVNSPTGNLTSSQSPIFYRTLVNTGHYNLSTGIFTCPVAGIYSFSVTLLANSSGTSNVNCYYRVNGSAKAYVRSHHEADDTTSSTMVVTLDVGDVVDLDCYGWDGVLHNSYGTSFSGVLITPT